MTTHPNVHVQRALCGLAIAGALMGAAYGGTTLAHADDTPPSLPTINLSDIPDLDTLPVCHAEDCSDVPGQTGVWFSRSTGAWLLERGEGHTWMIVDDTAASPEGDTASATSPQGAGAPATSPQGETAPVDHGAAAADGAVPGVS